MLCTVMSAERKFVYRRTVKLGETFIPAYPNCVPELPAPPFTEQEAAAAAAAGGAASAAGTAYWGTGAEGVAAAAAGYGTYVPQQEAVAWQQPVAAPAQPRAPKLSKKQRQQQALAAKKAAQAAAKKNKKRRRDDDFASDDESFEVRLRLAAVCRCALLASSGPKVFCPLDSKNEMHVAIVASGSRGFCYCSRYSCLLPV